MGVWCWVLDCCFSSLLNSPASLKAQNERCSWWVYVNIWVKVKEATPSNVLTLRQVLALPTCLNLESFKLLIYLFNRNILDICNYNFLFIIHCVDFQSLLPSSELLTLLEINKNALNFSHMVPFALKSSWRRMEIFIYSRRLYPSHTVAYAFTFYFPTRSSLCVCLFVLICVISFFYSYY